MTTQRLPSLFAAAALLLGVPQAHAESAPQAGSPRPWLEKKVDEVRTLAEEKSDDNGVREERWRAEAKRLIDEMLDWNELTERALGRHWKKHSKKEQQEFGQLLKEMIEASYQSKLKLASKKDFERPKKVDVEWLEESIEGDEAQLSAKLTVDKKKAVLSFDLKRRNGSWQVYDLSIDDVSTVRTYRSQFGKIIAKEGFPALLERMRKKIADIREGRAELGP